MALTPVGLALAAIVENLLARIPDVDIYPASGTVSMTPGQFLLIEVPTYLVMLAAPVIAFALGLRTARAGNRSGATAAVVAGAIGVILITWIVVIIGDMEFV